MWGEDTFKIVQIEPLVFLPVICCLPSIYLSLLCLYPLSPFFVSHYLSSPSSLPFSHLRPHSISFLTFIVVVVCSVVELVTWTMCASFYNISTSSCDNTSNNINDDYCTPIDWGWLSFLLLLSILPYSLNLFSFSFIFW